MNFVSQVVLVICVLLKTNNILVFCEKLYSNTFAVHIKGGSRVARDVIEEHGFTYLGEVRIDTIPCYFCDDVYI